MAHRSKFTIEGIAEMPESEIHETELGKNIPTDQSTSRVKNQSTKKITYSDAIQIAYDLLILDESSIWRENAIKYMQMDGELERLTDQPGGSERLLILLEPWLRAAAERGCFVSDAELQLLEYFIDSRKTFRCFTASVAAERGHKKMVSDLMKKYRPVELAFEDNAQAETATSINPGEALQSWLYIIWRFLVESKSDSQSKDQWQRIAIKSKSLISAWTFLHFAAAWGDLECIKELMGSEANIDIDVPTNIEGYTPLHLASYHDNAAIVELLVKHHAKVNEPDRRGRTSLHHASERGCLDSVKALLEHAKNTIEVEAKDHSGMTALHLAACRGETEVVRELLSRTQNPNLKSGCNLTDKKVLINHFLQQREREQWQKYEWYNFEGEANLECCFASDATILQPNELQSEVWSPEGFTALHFAVVYGNIGTIKEILEHGERESLMKTKDSLGLTPVEWAKVVNLEGHITRADQHSDSRKVEDGTLGLMQLFCCSSQKVTSFKFENAKRHYHEVKEAEQERMRLQWTFDMSEALLSLRWHKAIWMTNQGVKQKIKIDDHLWKHLKKAISSALDSFEPTRKYRRSLIQSMVVELVEGKAFFKCSSAMQMCLMWAIKEEMVNLVKVIVRESGCEMLRVEYGCDYDKSPLEEATDMGEPGLQVVAMIEQQEDVKKLLYEDRQVYVDYANTILVGAVLIAALAFQGWVQQPQGYADMPLKSDAKGMQIFARCNSLGFFFAMGAFMSGAVGAMPLQSGQFVKYKEKAIQAAAIASLLMAISVACEVVGFASAIVSVKSHRKDMLLSSRFGTVIVFMLSAWFLARLNQLQPILGLLLQALPNTLLALVRGIFSFWRILCPAFRSRAFKRFVLNPSLVFVLHPLLRSPPFDRLIRKPFTSYIIKPIQGLSTDFRSRKKHFLANFNEALDNLEQKAQDFQYKYIPIKDPSSKYINIKK